MVHRLEFDMDAKTKKVEKDYRRWVVQKNRLGRCREFYFEEDSGDLKLRAKQEVFPNCTAQLVDVLKVCFLEGQEEVSKGQIVTSVEHSAKTVENCLAKAVAAKHPEICRVRRGKYKLAPKLQEALKSAQVDGGEVSKKALSDSVVSSPRQTPDRCSEVSEKPLRGNVGGSPATNSCNGSGASSPRQGVSYIEVPIEGDPWVVELRRIDTSNDVEAG